MMMGVPLPSGVTGRKATLARRSAGRVDALSPLVRELPRIARARMTKIKIISRRRRQWNSLAEWRRHARALVRESVRFLQRFEFF